MSENKQLPENDACFKSSLVDTEPYFRGSIKTLKDNPEKIIRLSKSNAKRGETEQEYHVAGKKLFYELRDKYGIAVPDIELVAHLINGEKAMVTVTDMIDGKNLDEVTFGENNRVAAEQYENFFDGMTKCCIDKFFEEGLYIADLKNEQFVYGKRKGDKEDKIYYVDVDPILDKYDPSDDFGRSYHCFIDHIETLISMIVKAEEKINKSRAKEEMMAGISQELSSFPNDDSFFVLIKARERLLSFFEQLPKDKGGYVLMKQELSASKEDLMLKFSDERAYNNSRKINSRGW